MYYKLKCLIASDAGHPDPDLWKEIKEKSKLKTIKKNKVLVDVGSNQKYLYFVAIGSFVVLATSKEGEQKAVWFHFDELFYIATAPDSFFRDQPTKYEIRALEDSVVIRFSRPCFDLWISKYPSFRRFYHQCIITDNVLRQEIKTQCIISCPKEFLAYLKASFTPFVDRVSSKYLAHFLGMSPEWLCKLKKRMVT
ncbi:MAG: Crp/Fnr family transcriptional regulator [Bacteroidota bacterium]